MATTMATTFGTSHVTNRRTVRTGSAASLRSLGPVAALGLLLAMLIVMSPGLARVPATIGAPGSLQSPPARIAGEAATGSVLMTADPTQQPGFPTDR
jgi:hypothetical protein